MENENEMPPSSSLSCQSTTQPWETRGGVADVPFTAECEILLEGDTFGKRHKDCLKKDGHPFYIPIKDFTMEHLPAECRTLEFEQEIQIISALTVKVTVFHTSLNRPNTFPDSSAPYPYIEFKGKPIVRFGTGYIFYDSIQSPVENGSCPCEKCKKSPTPKSSYLQVIVGTATHVVYDRSEAMETKCECFYDSEEEKGAKWCLYGVGAKIVTDFHRCLTDYCEIICVTHDKRLIKRLRDLTLVDRFHYNRRGMSSCSQGVMVSHPHGSSKHISIGKILDGCVLNNAQLPTDSPLYFGPNTKCRVPLSPPSSYSGSVSSPSPSNSTFAGGDIPLQTFSSNIHNDGEEEEKVVNSTSPYRPLTQKSNSIGGFLRRGLQKCKSIFSSSSSSASSHLATSTCASITPAYRDYPIPSGMFFTLPKDSKQLGFFHHPLNNREVWMKFPEGTKFFSSDGRQILIPQEAMFRWAEMDNYISKCLHYITYNIVTCNGCSGAPILACSSKYLGLFLFHAGFLEKGKNRSGLTPVFSLMH